MSRIHSFCALLTILSLSFFTLNVSAFLFAQCGPVHRERIDPLISPGKESAHMHTFFGSDAVSSTSTTSDQLRQGCSSCDNQLDKSLYWVPTLYYVTQNPETWTPVEPNLRAYYQGQWSNASLFPENYGITVGDPNATLDNLNGTKKAGVNWYCWGNGSPTETKDNWVFPKGPCPWMMNGDIAFSSQVIFDSSINRYRACRDGDADCLSIPDIFFQVSYYMGDYNFTNGARLELSTGGAETYHADMIIGWDKSALDQLSHDTTSDLEIGSPDSLNVSPACNSSQGHLTNITKRDTQLRKEMLGGTLVNDINPGTYGIDLTVTDGLSINANVGVSGDSGSMSYSSMPPSLSYTPAMMSPSTSTATASSTAGPMRYNNSTGPSSSAASSSAADAVTYGYSGYPSPSAAASSKAGAASYDNADAPSSFAAAPSKPAAMSYSNVAAPSSTDPASSSVASSTLGEMHQYGASTAPASPAAASPTGNPSSSIYGGIDTSSAQADMTKPEGGYVPSSVFTSLAWSTPSSAADAATTSGTEQDSDPSDCTTTLTSIDIVTVTVTTTEEPSCEQTSSASHGGHRHHHQKNNRQMA